MLLTWCAFFTKEKSCRMSDPWCHSVQRVTCKGPRFRLTVFRKQKSRQCDHCGVWVVVCLQKLSQAVKLAMLL